MARVPLELAYTRRADCHKLRSDGLSIRAIASSLGLPICSVQNYLAMPVPSSDPAVVRASLVDRKQSSSDGHRGAMELRQLLAADFEVVPSETTLARWAAPYARRGRARSSFHAPYWCEDRPSRYLDQVQLDTVKIRTTDGVLVELLTARDVYSGATFLQRQVGTHSGMARSVARVFSVFGGIPRTIQCDNGTTDFSMARRRLLRPWHRMAFAAGVERIQFIPEAEPRRNGSVESFHDWLQDEWSNHGVAAGVTDDTLDAWIADRVQYYNYVKPLSSLGGKADRRVPAAVALSLDLGAQLRRYPIPDSVSSGVISFTRLVVGVRVGSESLAVAVVRAPAMVVAVPRELEGSYIRLDLAVAGAGVVLAPRPIDREYVIASGDRVVRGRFAARADAAPVVLGSFDHEIATGLVTDGVVSVELAADLDLSVFSPIVSDMALLRRKYARILKQRVPSLTADYEFRLLADGSWEALKGGEIVWSSESSPEVLEHAREIL